MTVFYFLSALIGYLLGSVSISVILSTYVLHADVRQHGSGNAGATNIARVFGARPGVLTLLGDMLKTVAAGVIGQLLAGRMGLVLACAGCVIGHSWPVFFKFRGGKGVAVSACIGLLLDWRFFLILFAVFFLVFFLTKRVSACSVVSALVYPWAYWLLHPAFGAEHILCFFICVLVVFLHRSNIRRLLRGEEAKFRFKSEKKTQ